MSVAAAVHPPSTSRRGLEVLIVGAGFGGIATAIELKRHGIGDITILERAPDLGGTWFYNSYPGAACDVPSQMYSFSYAQRRDWSRLCSPQPEIHDYLRDVARDHDVERLIETGATVTSCEWDEERCRWTVHTARGDSREADVLVLATGQLHKPAMPSIEGIGTFAGHSFHSAQWDHGYPLEGKRVAVVGTGASAVQFVPEIAGRVARLTVFQRTGNWFMPRRNRRYPAIIRAAIEHVPGVQPYRRKFMFAYLEALTAAIRHPDTLGRLLGARSARFMRSQLKDPELLAKVWPGYTFGCKRVLFSSHFLPALQRANVELVTDAIASIEPEGIRTADGRLHELDCIVWSTGFRVSDFMLPMEVLGAGRVALADSWAGGAHAHLGMSVAGFPNMFVMYGPNTNTSGGSIITYLEAEASYVRQGLERLCARGAGALEVRSEVEAASDRALQARFAGTAWTRCNSWYLDDSGRNVANWPGYMREYLQQTRSFVASEYRFLPQPGRSGGSISGEHSTSSPAALADERG